MTTDTTTPAELGKDEGVTEEQLNKLVIHAHQYGWLESEFAGALVLEIRRRGRQIASLRAEVNNARGAARLWEQIATQRGKDIELLIAAGRDVCDERANRDFDGDGTGLESAISALHKVMEAIDNAE